MFKQGDHFYFTLPIAFQFSSLESMKQAPVGFSQKAAAVQKGLIQDTEVKTLAC